MKAISHLDFLMFGNLSILRLSLVCCLPDKTWEPRNPILGKFLESIHDDSANFGRVFAKLVGETCSYIEGLRGDAINESE